MPAKTPFQLLEINVISAQDLASITRSMHTYAVVWVHPERKLTTRVDQNGHTNPTWNEKFVFRVDSNFLKSDSSAIMIDIYSQAWLKNNHKIGTVRVLISNLLPPSTRASPDRSDMKFVALQVRRPSGRPQGILNLGVALLDSTMRSMPLYTELSASAVGVRNLMDGKTRKSNAKDDIDTRSTTTASTISQLRRVKSERTDLGDENLPKQVINNNPFPYNDNGNPNGSMCNSSMCNGSELGPKANGSLCSDVGPSASVVAAAIAKGIYPPKMKPGEKYVANHNENSILNGWTEKDSVEGLKSKIMRWRSELPAVYDHQDYRRTHKGKKKRRKKNKGGLFSCFGNAYGIEFSITCGGPNGKKKSNGGKPHLSPSDMNYTESSI